MKTREFRAETVVNLGMKGLDWLETSEETGFHGPFCSTVAGGSSKIEVETLHLVEAPRSFLIFLA